MGTVNSKRFNKNSWFSPAVNGGSPHKKKLHYKKIKNKLVKLLATSDYENNEEYKNVVTEIESNKGLQSLLTLIPGRNPLTGATKSTPDVWHPLSDVIPWNESKVDLQLHYHDQYLNDYVEVTSYDLNVNYNKTRKEQHAEDIEIIISDIDGFEHVLEYTINIAAAPNNLVIVDSPDIEHTAHENIISVYPYQHTVLNVTLSSNNESLSFFEDGKIRDEYTSTDSGVTYFSYMYYENKYPIISIDSENQESSDENQTTSYVFSNISEAPSAYGLMIDMNASSYSTYNTISLYYSSENVIQDKGTLYIKGLPNDDYTDFVYIATWCNGISSDISLVSETPNICYTYTDEVTFNLGSLYKETHKIGLNPDACSTFEVDLTKSSIDTYISGKIKRPISCLTYYLENSTTFFAYDTFNITVPIEYEEDILYTYAHLVNPIDNKMICDSPYMYTYIYKRSNPLFISNKKYTYSLENNNIRINLDSDYTVTGSYYTSINDNTDKELNCYYSGFMFDCLYKTSGKSTKHDTTEYDTYIFKDTYNSIYTYEFSYQMYNNEAIVDKASVKFYLNDVAPAKMKGYVSCYTSYSLNNLYILNEEFAMFNTTISVGDETTYCGPRYEFELKPGETAYITAYSKLNVNSYVTFDVTNENIYDCSKCVDGNVLNYSYVYLNNANVENIINDKTFYTLKDISYSSYTFTNDDITFTYNNTEYELFSKDLFLSLFTNTTFINNWNYAGLGNTIKFIDKTFNISKKLQIYYADINVDKCNNFKTHGNIEYCLCYIKNHNQNQSVPYYIIANITYNGKSTYKFIYELPFEYKDDGMQDTIHKYAFNNLTEITDIIYTDSIYNNVRWLILGYTGSVQYEKRAPFNDYPKTFIADNIVRCSLNQDNAYLGVPEAISNTIKDYSYSYVNGYRCLTMNTQYSVDLENNKVSNVLIYNYVADNNTYIVAPFKSNETSDFVLCYDNVTVQPTLMANYTIYDNPVEGLTYLTKTYTIK